ncbi:MAG: hypothetical protein WCP28_07685 [Actinomycetes bacterium]
MAAAPDRPTRFAADLLDSAAVEGARASRSTKQQLDHWARVGRAVEMHHSVAVRRVADAIAGALPMTSLSEGEAVVVNAEIDAAIQERARAISFGERLAAEGVTTVALDDNGNLMRHHPDGTVSALTDGQIQTT